MYGTVASLRQTPEANITLSVNDTTIIKLKKKKKSSPERSFTGLFTLNVISRREALRKKKGRREGFQR